MQKVIKFLDGKKTHITAFVMAVINFLNVMEIVKIDQVQVTAINGMFLALLVMFLRLGIGKKAGDMVNISYDVPRLHQDPLDLKIVSVDLLTAIKKKR